MKVVVSGRRSISAGVIELELSAESGSLPSWSPGAHIDIHLPGDVSRQYSLTSDPQNLASYRIAVLREHDGRGGSKYLHESVQVGDTLEVTGPRNHFSLLEARGGTTLVAAGIGITPIIVMAEEMTRRNEPFDLYFMARGEESAPYLDRVRSIPGAIIHFSSEAGRLDVDSLIRESGQRGRIYCCGPTGFIEQAKSSSADLPVDTFIYEKFQADQDVGPREDDDTIEVECVRMGLTIPVGPTESILDALNRAGANIPHDCAEGICGTCEVRVLAGEIDHRDEVLLQSEKDSGDIMLVCCSRARGSRLVLDV